MINEDIKIEKRETVVYDPFPEEVYTVELIDIELQEKPKYKNPKETEKVFSFTYGVVDEGEYRARRLWRNYVPTYLYISTKNGKNVLYQIVEAHLKREMTPKEEAELDSQALNKLIGGQVRVVVKNTTKDDKTYSNISSFLKSVFPKPALTEEEKAMAEKKETSLEEVLPGSKLPENYDEKSF